MFVCINSIIYMTVRIRGTLVALLIAFPIIVPSSLDDGCCLYAVVSPSLSPLLSCSLECANIDTAV